MIYLCILVICDAKHVFQIFETPELTNNQLIHRQQINRIYELYINYTPLSILSLLLLLHSDCFGTAQFQSNSEVVSCFPWFLLSSMFLVRPGKAGVPRRSVILSPLKKSSQTL